MLTEKQMDEIREHLEKAQNPLFYYDNDLDGLCSFLLLRKFIGRGKGVAVKSYPDLNIQYAKRVQELNADYVFILDKPLLSKEFVEEIDRLQVPLVWIDHHDIEGSNKAIEEKIEKENAVFVYNPTQNKGKNKSSEPVTYLCYNITKRKEDLWIATMGCIADHYMPDFASDFRKEYPEYWSKNKIEKPFDAYYGTEIGRIAQGISFGLKDSITHVVQLQNFLISCKSPSDVFQEGESNHAFRAKFSEIKKKYDVLLSKAKDCDFGKLIFFDYTGDLSISAEIANELSHKNPGKYIAVAFIKSGISNVSLRGKGVKKILEKLLKQFSSASGGGHDDAAGARVKTDDLAKFRESLEKEIN